MHFTVPTQFYCVFLIPFVALIHDLCIALGLSKNHGREKLQTANTSHTRFRLIKIDCTRSTENDSGFNFH